LKADHHIIASSAETIGTFNTVFDTVNLHHPTVLGLQPGGEHHAVPPQVEFESII
jgi:hypothetical protein